MQGKAAKLEAYRFQLTEVKKRLLQEPTNSELLALSTKLEKLIELVSAEKAVSKKEEKKLKAGDPCEACFGNEWYEAKIQSLDKDGYLIVFTGTTETIHYSINGVRPCQSGQSNIRPCSEKPKKTEISKINPVKRKRLTETQERKEKEQTEKQDSWKKFNAKIQKRSC